MKAYICNRCGNQQDIKEGGYDLPPTGWFSLRQWGILTPERHLCSVNCLDHVVNDLIREELKAAAVTVVETPEAARG